MDQICLEEQVAQATGESLREVRRRGFGLLDQFDVDCESTAQRPRIVDWGAVDAQRARLFP